MDGSATDLGPEGISLLIGARNAPIGIDLQGAVLTPHSNKRKVASATFSVPIPQLNHILPLGRHSLWLGSAKGFIFALNQVTAGGR